MDVFIFYYYFFFKKGRESYEVRERKALMMRKASESDEDVSQWKGI